MKPEDVEKEIEGLQKRNARMILADRPVKEGDTVLLDYSGFVGEEQFEGGTAERQELKIGSGRPFLASKSSLLALRLAKRKT